MTLSNLIAASTALLGGSILLLGIMGILSIFSIGE